MKFSIDQQVLNKALSFVSVAVPSKTTLHILKGFLLDVSSDGKLTITASDRDLTIQKSLNTDYAEEGKIVVTAKLFSDIIRKLPAGSVTVSVDDSNNVISIKSNTGEFKIVGLQADDYPDISDKNDDDSSVQKVSINKEIFREMIRKTSFAASSDDSKGVIVGTFLEAKEGCINMAALDGFRLAHAKEETSDNQEASIIVPARTMAEIGRIMPESSEDEEKIDLVFDENKAVIRMEDSILILRLLQGRFLNYRDLIPTNFNTRVTVDRLALIDSLERTSLMVREGRNNLVRINVSGDIMKLSSDSDQGTVEEILPVSTTGDDIVIGFNSKYLLEGIKVFDEESITLFITNAISPCVIKADEADGYTYMVLPVRIMV